MTKLCDPAHPRLGAAGGERDLLPLLAEGHQRRGTQAARQGGKAEPEKSRKDLVPVLLGQLRGSHHVVDRASRP
jgi:hypothetical protein